jgi:hypothetical protein
MQVFKLEWNGALVDWNPNTLKKTNEMFWFNKRKVKSFIQGYYIMTNFLHKCQ